MKRLPMVLLFAGLSLAAAARAEVTLDAGGIYALRTNPPHASRPGAAIAAGWTWNSRFALELGVRTFRFPVDASPGGLSAGTISALPIELAFRARFPLGPGLTLSGAAGAGLTFYSFTPDEAVLAAWKDLGFTLEESVKDRPTAHLGAGLEYTLSPTLALDVGLRWNLFRTAGEWSITDDATATRQAGTVESLRFDTLAIFLGLKVTLFGRGESQ